MDTTVPCINPVIFHSLCDYGELEMMILIKRQTSQEIITLTLHSKGEGGGSKVNFAVVKMIEMEFLMCGLTSEKESKVG